MSKELRRRTGVDSKIIKLVLRNYHNNSRETLQHGMEHTLHKIDLPQSIVVNYWGTVRYICIKINIKKKTRTI